MARLQEQIARLNDLSVPLTRAGIIVRDAAVTRIKEQGGDETWAPSKKTLVRTIRPMRKGGLPLTIEGSGHTGIDTGRMWQSIGISQNNADSVTIGTNVRYARWFQEGTGIFAGHAPWTVHAKSKKALAFDGIVVKSATIPGQPGRVFLKIGDSERTKIRAAFEAWFLRGSTSVGGVDLG